MNPGRIITVEQKAVTVVGKFPRVAKLQSEYYVCVDDPVSFAAGLKSAGVNADLFTFTQGLHERAPKYAYASECDRLAVLPVSTYDHWFNKQLFFKPRNKLRKALKAGVETRIVEFNDKLIVAIKDVYDESPTRQGKPNKHYRKDLGTLKREHGSFLERSQFVGAFYQREMIGFAKVTHTEHYSVLMNIVSKICHRDKAPTNALIAKAVELCAARNQGLLMYSVWEGQGLTDFKEANGFERFDIPRYYVPLNWRGWLALRFRLHRRLADVLPAKVVRVAANLRSRFAKLRATRRKVAEQN